MADIYTIRLWKDVGLVSLRYGVTDFHTNSPDGKPSRIGVLVPDSRLQDIKDAWKNFRSMNSPLLREMTGLIVTDKLDALIKEGES